MARHGSTLIELLAVIAIGAILMILAMPVALQPREPIVRAPAPKNCAANPQTPFNPAKTLFERLDSAPDGRITLEEWQECFQKLSQERGYLTANDLAPLLARPSPSAEIAHGDDVK